jgi:hypothetical protein
MVRAGVLGQRDVLSGFPRTGNVRAALCSGDVVVRQPVENADYKEYCMKNALTIIGRDSYRANRVLKATQQRWPLAQLALR